MDEPFFAAISRRIDKRASTALPTAGVMVNPDSAQFEMLYNPEFFANLSDLERTDVLKHEFYHIIFQHVTDRLPADVNIKKWNIATDLAINSHLNNLPEGGLIPGATGPFEHLPRGMSAEWYMANLPSFDTPPGNCQGDDGSAPTPDDSPGTPGSPGSATGGDNEESAIPDTLDDHSGWGKCPQETRNIAKERLKDHLRKATEEASRNNSWGSISSSVRKEVMKTFETKIDWKKLLRYFVASSQRADRSSSMKRINRRYAYIHPGRRSNHVAKIAISIDQSGSVSDIMLGLFFAELNKLSKVAEFVVVPFDTQVDEDKVFTWKKGQKRPLERVLSGGTCFNAPTEYVNERKFDGHIVLTDMCAPKPKASKCQRMWMTTPNCLKYQQFETKERVIAIE
jgi:predicted metal-dependent peptidase